PPIVEGVLVRRRQDRVQRLPVGTELRRVVIVSALGETLWLSARRGDTPQGLHDVAVRPVGAVRRGGEHHTAAVGRPRRGAILAAGAALSGGPGALPELRA